MESPQYIIGIDEAGRGPLAGPVYVGVVMATASFDFSRFRHLDDSKQMTETRREAVYQKLQEMNSNNLITTATYSQAATVDSCGIEIAIQRAINRGLRRITSSIESTKVYLDGGLNAPQKFSQATVVGGDGKIPVISLASVIAKVARDRRMKRLAKQYPDFNLDQHKGYGTAAHRQAIKKHGLSTVHRKTFCKNVI